MKRFTRSFAVALTAVSCVTLHATDWTQGMKEGKAEFKSISQLAFGPEGILFVADQVDGLQEIPRKVWLQPYPRGEPRRLTPDLLEYRNISVRGDGSAFVSVGLDAIYSLWRLPLDGQAPQRFEIESGRIHEATSSWLCDDAAGSMLPRSRGPSRLRNVESSILYM